VWGYTSILSFYRAPLHVINRRIFLLSEISFFPSIIGQVQGLLGGVRKTVLCIPCVGLAGFFLESLF